MILLEYRILSTKKKKGWKLLHLNKHDRISISLERWPFECQGKFVSDLKK